MSLLVKDYKKQLKMEEEAKEGKKGKQIEEESFAKSILPFMKKPVIKRDSRLYREASNTFFAKLYKFLNRTEEIDDVRLAKIVDIFEKLSSQQNRLGLFTGDFMTQHYYDDEIVAGLADVGILYYKRHVSLICYSDSLYFLVAKDYVASLKNRMSLKRRWRINSLKHKHGYFFRKYMNLLGEQNEEHLDKKMKQWNSLGDLENVGTNGIFWRTIREDAQSRF